MRRSLSAMKHQCLRDHYPAQGHRPNDGANSGWWSGGGSRSNTSRTAPALLPEVSATCADQSGMCTKVKGEPASHAGGLRLRRPSPEITRSRRFSHSSTAAQLLPGHPRLPDDPVMRPPARSTPPFARSAV